MDENEALSGIAFAELVMHKEEIYQLDEERAPVFKLSDLSQLYTTRLEQTGVKLDVKVYTTWLKQYFLTYFTDIHAQKKGRDVLMAFQEDIDTALAKACELDSVYDAIHLTRAAKIVHNYIFNPLLGCQKESVYP